MALKLSNNADGLLAMAISNSATSLTLRAGHGSRFPALGSGDWFPITVVRASDPSQFEIMRCTARTLDTLTVERAQEGTSAITFDAGDVVSLRLTSGTLEENFPQVEGRNAKNLRFSIDSVGGKPELKFKSGDNEEWVEFYHSGNINTANAGTATKLQTARTISLSGAVSGSASFDGSANATINTSIEHPSPGNWFGGIPRISSSGNMEVGRNIDFHVVSDSTTDYDGRLGIDGNGDLYYRKNDDTPKLVYHSGNLAQLISDANLVQTSRTISAGTGLTGGGNLSANRTISLATSHFPIGVGQTWRDVTSSRSSSTIYTNTVGRPIYVAIHLGAGGIAEVSEDGTNWVSVGNAGTTSASCSFIVPAGYRYRYRTINLSFVYWAELR